MSLDPNFTLAVDELNNGTTVEEDFEHFETVSNRSIYTSEHHTAAFPNRLNFYRSMAKPAGNFPGTNKTSAKFSRDYVITGNDGLAQIKAPLIAEVSFSIPNGIGLADIVLAQQRLLALLDHPLMVKLCEKLHI